MRSKHHIVALILLVASVGLGHAAEQKPFHADHMEHHFDPKESALRWDDPKRDLWQLPDRVITTLQLKPGHVVGDIGAGTGYFSIRLAKSKAAPQVYAVDIQPSMVSYLRERAAKEGVTNVTAIQAAADQPNLPKPVDVILMVNTYHHIGDRVAYFRKLATSLKPGGRVAIIDFKLDSPVGPPKEFRFPPDRFESEMREAGYTLEGQHTFLPRQYFFVFTVVREVTDLSK